MLGQEWWSSFHPPQHLDNVCEHLGAASDDEDSPSRQRTVVVEESKKPREQFPRLNI